MSETLDDIANGDPGWDSGLSFIITHVKVDTGLAEQMPLYCFHSHALLELVFVISGKSEIWANTGRARAEGPFLILYPKGMLHIQQNREGTPYERYAYSVPEDICEYMIAQNDGVDITDRFLVIRPDAASSGLFDKCFSTLNETTPTDSRRRRT